MINKGTISVPATLTAASLSVPTSSQYYATIDASLSTLRSTAATIKAFPRK